MENIQKKSMLLISDEKTLSREIDNFRKSGKLINFILQWVIYT